MIGLSMTSPTTDQIIRKSSLMNNVNFNVNRVKDRRRNKSNFREVLSSMYIL